VKRDMAVKVALIISLALNLVLVCTLLIGWRRHRMIVVEDSAREREAVAVTSEIILRELDKSSNDIEAIRHTLQDKVASERRAADALRKLIK